MRPSTSWEPWASVAAEPRAWCAWLAQACITGRAGKTGSFGSSCGGWRRSSPDSGTGGCMCCLRRAGVLINHKRVQRLYREEGLALRHRRRRKRACTLRVPMPAAARPNHRWSMDFVSDVLATGRRIRVLTVVDDYTRECPAIEVDTSLNGLRVTQVLERLAETRGLPEVIRTDNGPEFSGRVLDAWAYRRDVKLDFIRPGKPAENSYVESFNGKLRDECLNEHWFVTLSRGAASYRTLEAELQWFTATQLFGPPNA